MTHILCTAAERWSETTTQQVFGALQFLQIQIFVIVDHSSFNTNQYT